VNVAFNTVGVSGTVNSFSNNRFLGGTISAIAPAGTPRACDSPT
jgi:hypothetical protein